MLKTALKDSKIITAVILIVLIKVAELDKTLIEYHYTYGVYPIISGFLRIVFGWIPFSIGDLLYLVFIIYLLIKIRKYILLLIRRQFTKSIGRHFVRKVFLLFAFIYIVFSLLWGLNYDRLGIASQLNLDVKAYTTTDLMALTVLLHDKLAQYAAEVDTVKREQLNHSKLLFHEAVSAYKKSDSLYPYLHYHHASIKPSLYSYIGQFIGFTGYYNPFSGEAQIKTNEPVYLKPFVVCHEMAHQLGYAKENEANFVGYLTAKNARNTNFQYSVYFELCLYALSDLRRRDSIAVKQFKNDWPERVKNDYRDLINYLEKTANPIEPYIMKFYDRYLKLNNQPHGNRTYNEVIAWLIAYMKKYGPEAI